MRTLISAILLTAYVTPVFAQAPAATQQGPAKADPKVEAANEARQKKWAEDQRRLEEQIREVDQSGLDVEVQTVAHFRGFRDFQLSGVGLVIGLDNSGDTTKSLLTQTLYANYFKSLGMSVDPTTIQAKNAALVTVTATMPAFSKPGTLIDVTVSSIADAKSLQGGTLILTPLYGPADRTTVIASAQGALSIGGFNASGSGSSVQKNHVTVGRIPSGGEIQTRIESKVVFDDAGRHKLYLDLEDPDPTTLSRVAHRIQAQYPQFDATPIDSTTVAITVPEGQDPSEVMSEVGHLIVKANIPAKVVINERTGTIVVGGNVTIGPAMVVSGSLNVRIDTTNDVVQPPPFSNGTTTKISNSNVQAGQDTARVVVLPPMTTVSDLARIFQALELKPNDVIQIMQLLQQQGAMKARIVIQ